MATYCTVRDVRAALTPDASETDQSTAASLPDWQINDAIVEAEGTINLYLATRYTITPVEVTEPDPASTADQPLPDQTFTVGPVPLRSWTRDIAAFLATLTFRRNKDLPADDPVRLRYAMVTGYLEAVRDGRMALELDTPDTVEGLVVVNPYEGTLFTFEDTGLGYDNSRVQRIDRLAPWEV